MTMMIGVDKVHEAVEAALPAHLIASVYMKMSNQGWIIREDVMKALDNACAVPLSTLTQTLVPLAVARISDDTDALLRDLPVSEERHGLIVAAAFALLLVVEGYLPPTNQASLVGLAFVDEVRTDPEAWGIEEAKAYELAKRVLVRARLMGLYSKELSRN